MKSYNERLQEALAKIYEVKDKDNRTIGIELANFIMSNINEELILSSIYILDIVVDTINLHDKKLFLKIRETEWYEDWFRLRGAQYVDLNMLEFDEMKEFERTEFCRDCIKYNIKDKINNLIDVFNDYGEHMFHLAANNFIINNGCYNHKEYNVMDLPKNATNIAFTYMALLNKDNMDITGKYTVNIVCSKD